MKKLEELTMKELIEDIGIPMDEKTIWLTFDSDEEVLKDFRDAIIEKSNNVLVTTDGRSIDISEQDYSVKWAMLMIKYEDRANKQALIGYSLYKIASYLEKNKEDVTKEERKQYEEAIKKYMLLLGKRNFNMIYIREKNEEGTVSRLQVINSQELMQYIKNGTPLQTLFRPSRKNQSRIDELERRVGLENIVGMLALSDFETISSYGNDVGEMLSDLSTFNLQRLQSKNGEDEKINLKNYYDTMANTIYMNLKYISIDRLYLVIAYRYIEALENGRINAEEGDYKDFLRLLSNSIAKGTKVEIRESVEETEKIDTTSIIAVYTLEDLLKDIERFHGKRYIRKSEVAEIHSQVVSGERLLSEIDNVFIGFLDFNSDEFEQIIKAREENVIHLIQIGAIETPTEFYHALVARGKCSNELLDLAIEKEIVDGKYLLYLYRQGAINLENIEFALQSKQDAEREGKIADKPNRLDFIDKDDLNKVIIEFYKKVTDNENKDSLQDLQEFYRFIDLYKLLNIKGKSEEEIEKASNSLIESFGDDLNSEIIEELYQYGLIRLKDAASWEINLNKMLAQGEIKPIDLKNLYSEGTIRLENIKNVLRGNSINYADKMWLIYSTFDGESKEEYDIRDELIQLLDTEEEYREEGKKIKSKEIEPDDKDKEKDKNKEKKARWREYVSDPHARWKLISLLDKDYSRAVLPEGMTVSDGHTIFLLPNSNKVVIEKMLEKKGGRQVSSYAAATYILDKDVFYKFLVAIVEEGKVIRSTLGDLARNGYATKIIHNKSWGKNMKEHFEINTENGKYSPEEIAQIDQAIENVEKSKQERE